MKTFFKILFLFVVFSACTEPNLETIEEPDSSSLQNRMTSPTNTNLLPIVLGGNNGCVIGVNGHPLTQNPYLSQRAIIDQCNDIKRHGFNYYRLELSAADSFSIDIINEILNQDIKILPVIKFVPNYDLSDEECYEMGTTIGSAIIQKLDLNNIHFDYFEVSNELDQTCLNVKGTVGDNVDKYNSTKVHKLSITIKRIIELIKSPIANANSKIVISYTGFLHTAYFQTLINNGVIFDVVGVHWYKSFGNKMSSVPHDNTTYNVLELLETNYGKPIWITEFNYFYSTEEKTQGITSEQIEKRKAQWLSDFINDFNGHRLVQGLFFYELYDEGENLNFLNLPLDERPDEITQFNEKNYGLLDVNYNPRIISDVAKYKAEEIKYGYEDFILNLNYKLYESPESPQSIAQHVIDLKNHSLNIDNNKDLVIDDFLKNRLYYEKFVKGLYQQIFNRQAHSNDNVGYWIDRMDVAITTTSSYPKLTREQMIKEFCKTSEFTISNQISNENFVIKLYKVFHGLQLTPSDSNVTYWRDKLNNNEVTKDYVIDVFIKSDVYHYQFIVQQYSNILDMANENDYSSSINYWVDQMKSPPNGISLSQRDLIKWFLKSEGFLVRSTTNGYLRRHGNLQNNQNHFFYFKYLPFLYTLVSDFSS